MSLANTPMIWNGQGPIMIGTYDPNKGREEMGFLTNLYSVGCGNRTFTTTPGRETEIIPESCSGQRLPLKEMETGKSLAVALEMVQYDGRTLARGFYGDAIEKPAGTVTGERLTELAVGDYFTLKHPRSSSVVIEDSTAGTPLVYVEGTHYEIRDPDHSLYRLLEHPATHVEPVLVDYAHAAYLNIAAFSKTNVERGIIFFGVNGDGQKGRVIVPRISLALSGDYGWLANTASPLTLGGQALYVPELANSSEYGPFMRIDLMPDLPM